MNVITIGGQRLAIVGCSDKEAEEIARALSLASNAPIFIEKEDPLSIIKSNAREEFPQLHNDLYLPTIDDYEHSEVNEKSYRENLRQFLDKRSRFK